MSASLIISKELFNCLYGKRKSELIFVAIFRQLLSITLKCDSCTKGYLQHFPILKCSFNCSVVIYIAQKMKFFIKGFFRK